MRTSLQQAIAEGRRFMVSVDREDFLRLAAEVYLVDTGVVFLEAGWPEPMARPRAHYKAGTPRSESYGWVIGDWIFSELDARDREDREAADHWENAKGICEEYGLDYSREAGARYASRVLTMEVKP